MNISILKKIWILAAVVLSLMASIWIALTYYNQQTQEQYNEILQRYISMNEASIASKELISSLNNYLHSSETAQKEVLGTSKQKIHEAKYEVYKLRNADNEFELSNYIHMMDSLAEAADRTLVLQAEKDTEEVGQTFAEATRISMYISEMTLTLINKELNTYYPFYQGIMEKSEALKRLGLWLLLLITFLLIIFTYWFSLSITRPLLSLSRAAKELSQGRFDLKIEVQSSDEISFLAKMFERMRVNINNLIIEIQEKAQLEKELRDNKLLLQESQLRSLQSQINPHFLFNTLDTISKKAYLEGSEETSDLLVNVAGLLRYNLKRLNRSVTLYEEVRVINQYIEIQKARFSERLHFHSEIDESCMHIQIPGLTLQPIIENAITHAVEPRELGGVIQFRIRDETDYVCVIIEDDGPGIPEHLIHSILNEQEIEVSSHSTGIGFSNVVQRLRLFYHISNVIVIQSTSGAGTKVILNLPKIRGSENDVQNTGRG
ncbi:sensor histidine kinase [Paenibacillus sp. F411]|uniref:sensor histidine kinase n=1 Tax=Paenibacillus sp. F411 TaxID=2820239 RepID=UPI001AAE8287|nr:sensor histidine kinase [Paenibacillus sp. F411]MBO2943500.1 sensor histidine kinase [Paenibacillus sp. F411]